MKHAGRLCSWCLIAGIPLMFLCVNAVLLSQESSQKTAASGELDAQTLILPESLFENVNIKGVGPGILSEESAAYYKILNHASQVSQQKLQAAALSYQQQRIREVKRYQQLQQRDGQKFQFPAFVDLFQHPERYIGKPVKLSGHARKYRSYPSGNNDQKIGMLHELWLYTEDSQQNPCVVVCTEIPDNLPKQDAVIEGISVTGYFFKMYVYSAEDTVRYAPMLLASTVKYRPPVESALTKPIPPAAYVIVVLALLGAVYALWRVAQGDRKSRQELLKHTQTTDEVDLTALEQELKPDKAEGGSLKPEDN